MSYPVEVEVHLSADGKTMVAESALQPSALPEVLTDPLFTGVFADALLTQNNS